MTNQELMELNQKRRIHQVCVITRDLEKTMKNWVEYLGIGPWTVVTFTDSTIENFQVHGESVTEPFKFLVALTRVGDLEFELVQPVYGPSIYSKFLEEKGEGLHHIKEKICDEDMDRVLADYREKGIEVSQAGQFGNRRFYYLNTEPFLDFIYELGNCPSGSIPHELITSYPKE